MNSSELHEMLTASLKLVPEPVANSVSRTYFYERVEWNPRQSTRIFRVMIDGNGGISGIQLCASSDNNNTELLPPPFDEHVLVEAAAKEIGKVKARLLTLEK
jgi:hypothetical protein